MSILIQNSTLGLNALLPASELDDRAAARGTQNILFDKGLIRTPWGFSKVNLTTTGLNSGKLVDSVFSFVEIDGYAHLMAKTQNKVYENNFSLDQWDDKTQSGKDFNSNLQCPVSYVVIAHNDTNIYLNDTGSTVAYYHLILSDGGNSDIQRWAGRYEDDFADLLGGDDYHNSSGAMDTHRAWQVGMYQSRLLLISPKEYDSASKTWVENKQRVRWPVIGKIQTWTGTGSGFVDLIDTGDTNVWGAGLGISYYIYQQRSIWDLRYVGGTDVFAPIPVVRDVGLLAPNLLQSYNNAHYFVGSDYNVYVYYGGSVKQAIGTQIQTFLKEDMNPDYEYRAWMSFATRHDRLWIFIVPEGSEYITKAYGYDMKNGSWTVRDFSRKYGTTSGITAVNLVGGQVYEIGDTYTDDLNQIGIYDESDAGDTTVRYGEGLLDTSRDISQGAGALTDFSDGHWLTTFEFSDAGLAAGCAMSKCVTNNDILAIFDGSQLSGAGIADNSWRWGTHFWTIYDVSTKSFAYYPSGDSSGVCAVNNVAICGGAVTNLGFFCLSTGTNNQTYAQVLEQVLTDEQMFIGDATGFVYKFDEALVRDSTTNIIASYYTKEFDFGKPNALKRFPGINVTARGTGLRLVYYIDNTSNNTDFSIIDLTDTFKQYNYRINKTGKKIWFHFSNLTDTAFTTTNLLDTDSSADWTGTATLSPILSWCGSNLIINNTLPLTWNLDFNFYSICSYSFCLSYDYSSCPYIDIEPFVGGTSAGRFTQATGATGTSTALVTADSTEAFSLTIYPNTDMKIKNLAVYLKNRTDSFQISKYEILEPEVF